MDIESFASLFLFLFPLRSFLPFLVVLILGSLWELLVRDLRCASFGSNTSSLLFQHGVALNVSFTQAAYLLLSKERVL